MNVSRQGIERVCWNKELRRDQADAAGWQEVCCLFERPERREQAYRRRLLPTWQPTEQDSLSAQISKLYRGAACLLDSSADGLIEKQECEPGVTRLRKRLQFLEEQRQQLTEESVGEEELR
jgi:hypothetical protein